MGKGRPQFFEVFLDFGGGGFAQEETVGAGFHADVFVQQGGDGRVIFGSAEVAIGRIILPGLKIDVGQRCLWCGADDAGDAG